MCEDSRRTQRKWLKSPWFIAAETLKINNMHNIPSDSDPRAGRRQRWIKFRQSDAETLDHGIDFFHMFSAFQARTFYKTF